MTVKTYSVAEMQKFLDADGGIFFGTELEAMSEKLFDTKYGAPSYAKVFPVNLLQNPWATSYAYKVGDEAGHAKVLGNDVNDLPQIVLSGKKVTAPIEAVGDFVKFSALEVAQAEKMGFSLSDDKFRAAKRAIERKVNDIFWNGDADFGLPGFRTASVGTSAVAKAWDGTASPAEILADITFAQSKINEDSKDVFMPNIIVCPPGIRNMLFNTQLTGTGKSIAGYMLENFSWLQEIISANELVGTAAAAKDGVLLMQRDPEVLEGVMATGIEIGDPIVKHLGYEIAMSARVCGLVVRQPLAMYELSAV